MDETSFPKPDGCQFRLDVAGEVWSWRLTTPEGESLAGFAPDPKTARRSAAFAAFAVTALRRTQQRRF